MVSVHIRRIAEDTYAVRQYDEVLSIDLGAMSVEKLHHHLRVQPLEGRTAKAVLDSLKVGGEITVQLRTLF